MPRSRARRIDESRVWRFSEQGKTETEKDKGEHLNEPDAVSASGRPELGSNCFVRCDLGYEPVCK